MLAPGSSLLLLLVIVAESHLSASEVLYRSYNSYGTHHYPAEPSSSHGQSYGGQHVNGAGPDNQYRNPALNGPTGPASHQFSGHRAPEGAAYNSHGVGDYRNEGRGRQEQPYHGTEVTSSSEAWERGAAGPSFDNTPPRNVTALKDANAYLHCIVNNLANRTLSWIREKDLHILTVGKVTYTADNRFEVIHKDSSNSWTLKINSVQPRDTGRYECQVNSHPTDPITFEVYLAVFVPTARIVGSTERYVDRGSTINLTCIINHNPDPPSATFWYHNNKVINYDSRGSRVSVITDRGTSTKTILLIHDASDSASGTYSCAPSPSAAASVKIHILNAGETPAAMQTNGGSALLAHRMDKQQRLSQHAALLTIVVTLTLLFQFTMSASTHTSIVSRKRVTDSMVSSIEGSEICHSEEIPNPDDISFDDMDDNGAYLAFTEFETMSETICSTTFP